MNRIEWLLTQAASEANEFAKAVTKALQFGLNTIEPGQTKTNKQRLVHEFIDLLATIYMLEDEEIIEFPNNSELAELFEKKRDKIEKHYSIARNELGTVVEDKPQPTSQSASVEEKCKTVHDATIEATKVLKEKHNITYLSNVSIRNKSITDKITIDEFNQLVATLIEETIQAKGSW